MVTSKLGVKWNLTILHIRKIEFFLGFEVTLKGGTTGGLDKFSPETHTFLELSA
jgi:hypothetical protein